MTPPFRLDRPRVRAVLGPTNTGKTHLAIERMLAHDGGIIGFPLRLLARENYDRMVARKGAAHVALITGEEKIVPPAARWFACTVEAMPLDRAVPFVAIDEIQLCADPDRGHIFTDRLLHARGFSETLFLGAETIAPLLRALAPGVEIETRPRLSQLTHSGGTRLGRLPSRSAIVAFTATEVYAIAEAVRRRRGGCAVVMGRLSPRTRNAQVALFQAKEVDYLVATDAIGMGLNMDVNHVAFASLSKFDGRRPRPLAAAEIAQIAGRAGRGMRDGTFGTLAGAQPIPPAVVEQVESHSFDRLEALAWRNHALDFASPDRLIASLAAPSPSPMLKREAEAADHQTLFALLRDAEVRALATSPRQVALLWEACCIPDFRKLGDDTHARFCARVFTALAAPPRSLPTDWLARSLQDLARLDGDIDTLMQRLAGVRIWAYVAARPGWIADAPHWQVRARETEDALSDALHERLTARFVDRRAAHLIRRLDAGQPEALAAVTQTGEVLVEGHQVGRLVGFAFVPDADDPAADTRRTLLRIARRVLGTEIRRRVDRLEAAGEETLQLDPQGRVLWRPPGSPDGADAWAPIARLRRGPTPATPRIEPVDNEFLQPADRNRIAARAARWLAAHLGALLGPLREAAAAADSGPLRGLAHLLNEGLGIVPSSRVPALPPATRPFLRRFGIRPGHHAAFMAGLLKPQPMRLRAILRAVADERPVLPLPPPGAVSAPLPTDGAWSAESILAHGWLTAGPLLLRLDIAERTIAALGGGRPAQRRPLPPDLAPRLGCATAHVPAVLRAIGFRLEPGEDGTWLCRAPRRRAPPGASAAPATAAAHPAFAALAQFAPRP